MSTDETGPIDAPRRRPPQGTPDELEDTQRWWLRWVYGPIMGLLAVGSFVAAVAGTGDRTLSAVLFALITGSLVGAAVRFWSQQRLTGRLAQDERDETSTMRTAGYAWCFSFFGALAWSVAWAATTEGGVPVPLLVLAGLGASVGLGRLCTRREGF